MAARLSSASLAQAGSPLTGQTLLSLPDLSLLGQLNFSKSLVPLCVCVCVLGGGGKPHFLVATKR